MCTFMYMYKTLWNGWTSEQTKPNNRCKFRCSCTAEDAIEHYCTCPVVQLVAQKFFLQSGPA